MKIFKLKKIESKIKPHFQFTTQVKFFAKNESSEKFVISKEAIDSTRIYWKEKFNWFDNFKENTKHIREQFQKEIDPDHYKNIETSIDDIKPIDIKMKPNSTLLMLSDYHNMENSKTETFNIKTFFKAFGLDSENVYFLCDKDGTLINKAIIEILSKNISPELLEKMNKTDSFIHKKIMDNFNDKNKIILNEVIFTHFKLKNDKINLLLTECKKSSLPLKYSIDKNEVKLKILPKNLANFEEIIDKIIAEEKTKIFAENKRQEIIKEIIQNKTKEFNLAETKKIVEETIFNACQLMVETNITRVHLNNLLLTQSFKIKIPEDLFVFFESFIDFYCHKNIPRAAKNFIEDFKATEKGFNALKKIQYNIKNFKYEIFSNCFDVNEDDTNYKFKKLFEEIVQMRHQFNILENDIKKLHAKNEILQEKFDKTPNKADDIDSIHGLIKLGEKVNKKRKIFDEICNFIAKYKVKISILPPTKKLLYSKID